MNLFENYVDNGLNFARRKCAQAMQQVMEMYGNYDLTVNGYLKQLALFLPAVKHRTKLVRLVEFR